MSAGGYKEYWSEDSSGGEEGWSVGSANIVVDLERNHYDNRNSSIR